MHCSEQPAYRVLLEKEGGLALLELLYLIVGFKSVNTLPSIVLALLERVTEAFPSISQKYFICFYSLILEIF